MSDVVEGVIAVIESVGLATVQDAGRRGMGHLGVPRAGAWHGRRYRAAVRVIDGDPQRTPAVELLQGHLRMRITRDVLVAVVGPAEVGIDGQRAAADTATCVRGGSVLEISHRGPGPVYAAITGWVEPAVLGSASTDTFSGIGGRLLASGDTLEGPPGAAPALSVGSFHRDSARDHGGLRVLGLGHAGWTTTPWRVTSTSRSGVRLRGGQVPSSGTWPSGPMVEGAVQCTPAGELIILGPDGGVTGGYPVVGVIATADVDRVSEVQIDTDVHFIPVDIPTAMAAHREGTESEQRSIVRRESLSQEGSSLDS